MAACVLSTIAWLTRGRSSWTTWFRRLMKAEASSSSIVSTTGSGPITPCVLRAVPDTVTVLSGAATALSTAAIVTVPVLVFLPAGTVRIGSALSR